MALGMQSPVNEQVRVVRLQVASVGAGVTCHHGRAEHQIGVDDRGGRVIKGEHVGRIVLAPELSVQSSTFSFTHDAHRDFSRRRQRRTNPTCHPMPLEHLPV